MHGYHRTAPGDQFHDLTREWRQGLQLAFTKRQGHLAIADRNHASGSRRPEYPRDQAGFLRNQVPCLYTFANQTGQVFICFSGMDPKAVHQVIYLEALRQTDFRHRLAFFNLVANANQYLAAVIQAHRPKNLFMAFGNQGTHLGSQLPKPFLAFLGNCPGIARQT